MRPSHAVCYFSLYHRCLRSSKGNNGQPYCLLENSKWSFTNKSEAKRLWYRIFASMCKRSLSLGQKPFQRRRYFIVEIVHVNCKVTKREIQFLPFRRFLRRQLPSDPNRDPYGIWGLRNHRSKQSQIIFQSPAEMTQKSSTAPNPHPGRSS